MNTYIYIQVIPELSEKPKRKKLSTRPDAWWQEFSSAGGKKGWRHVVMKDTGISSVSEKGNPPTVPVRRIPRRRLSSDKMTFVIVAIIISNDRPISFFP